VQAKKGEEIKDLHIKVRTRIRGAISWLSPKLTGTEQMFTSNLGTLFGFVLQKKGSPAKENPYYYLD